MKYFHLTIIISILFSGCARTTELPPEFTGTWINHLTIEGTDGELEVVAEISNDTILIKTTFPRMAGIDKIKTIYPADEIEKVSDKQYQYYTTVNGITSRISLEMTEEHQLHLNFCQLTEITNKDAEFSSCTEWGVFERK